jgi:hypothetical protein
VRRIGGHHLAGHQPIEQHPDAGEMLLYGGRRPRSLQRFDIGGHMHRLDLAERADPLPRAPAQEGAGSARISRPRVWVANVDREELDEAPGGALAGAGDQRRQLGPCVSDDGQIIHGETLADLVT